MKIAITADLHYHLHNDGDKCTEDLAKYLIELQPDIFIIDGDTGVGETTLRACLKLFSNLKCTKLLIAGNHCIWRNSSGHSQNSSFKYYTEDIPRIAESEDFQYVDTEPYKSEDNLFAIIGNINWYDYSYASPLLLEKYSEETLLELYKAKRFITKRHNDGVYVFLGQSDNDFTSYLVKEIKKQLDLISSQVEDIMLITHHPAIPELFYPKAPQTDEHLIWLAYSGNRALTELITQYPKIRYVISAHTHASVEVELEQYKAFNIGGDYHWKRLLLLDYPEGKWEAVEFH